jgi:hypothetical protein
MAHDPDIDPSLIVAGHVIADRIFFGDALGGLYLPAGRPLRGQKALASLLSIAQRTEERLAALMADHSAYYWLWLARRHALPKYLAPTKLPSTQTQVRRTFDCAAAKFGQRDANDTVDDPHHGIRPNVSTNRDMIQFFAALYLSEHLYHVASAYRRTAKGGTLTYNEGVTGHYPIASEMSEDLEARLADGDRRNQAFGGPLNIWGSFEESRIDDIDPDWAKLPIACAWHATSVPFSPGWILATGLNDAVGHWERFDARIRSTLTPAEFIELLAALTRSQWRPDKDGYASRRDLFRAEMIRLGYSAFEKGFIREQLEAVYPKIAGTLPRYGTKRGNRRPEETVDAFLECCTFGHISSGIDVNTWTGTPLIWKHEQLDVIDWVSVGMFLVTWVNELDPLARDDGASERGKLFEREVRDYIDRCLGPRVTLWPHPTSPRASSKRVNKGADVDVGVIVGKTLGLIQCVIHVRTFRDLPSAADDDSELWQRARKKLAAVDHAAHKLSTGLPTKNGHYLPAQVRQIIPLVCCPAVVHVRSDADRFELRDGVPRVCTPQEVVRLLEVLTRTPEAFASSPSTVSVPAR